MGCHLKFSRVRKCRHRNERKLAEDPDEAGEVWENPGDLCNVRPIAEINHCFTVQTVATYHLRKVDLQMCDRMPSVPGVRHNIGGSRCKVLDLERNTFPSRLRDEAFSPKNLRLWVGEACKTSLVTRKTS